MIPHPAMGGATFVEVGREFERYFIELAGLKPDWRVLDVGCGMGRMAVPLTGHLLPPGEYWGFDVQKRDIQWCQSRITPKFPNFHFEHSNIYNRHYNRGGKIAAHEFQFPFPDGTFDFVYLTSVFTHLVPLDLEHYVSEISRVLKPGAVCLTTWFLLNPESKGLIHAGRSTQDFAHELAGDTSGAGCLVVNEEDPEGAIAFEEGYVHNLHSKYRLHITAPVHYGCWCQRPSFLSYQDIVIATKNTA